MHHMYNQETEDVNFAGGGVIERTWTGMGHSQSGNYRVFDAGKARIHGAVKS